jgi:hypothetical protein
MAAVSCPLAVFKARKLHSPLPKPTPQAAPGKPLIFHGFALECPESQHGLAPVHIIS